jgi:hypothetical protein
LRVEAVRVIRDQLEPVIARYTPSMLEDIKAADAGEIDRLEAAAGPLPAEYRGFLEWMGNGCPPLDNSELSYSPAKLLRVYEDPEDPVPEGFLLIGIDDSGNAVDLHIRRADGMVLRLSEWYDGVEMTDAWPENVSFASYVATAYVQKVLVPSHPANFAAGFTGDEEQLTELRHRIEEACSHFEISHRLAYPDFRFYGGTDFVLALRRRPGTAAVTIHFGSIDRARYEPWYDLVFARWGFVRTVL